MYITLFVGNLNFATTNDQLLSLLKNYGQIIKCNVIVDNFTLRSKGFAHVEVIDEKTAEKIRIELNGFDFEGRPLKIEYFK